MKLGLLLGYSGKSLAPPMDLIKQAENMGIDSVWIAEAYGSDAVTVAAWVLGQTTKLKVGTAIMQVPARTPANTAMTAMSMSQLSGGRFVLGLGASGPQVVEGWHGIGYDKPLMRLRECIEIVREIFARQGPVSYDGEIYQLPFKGQGSVGMGKSLKSILHEEKDTPIYTASFTPAGFRLAGEIADGLFPVFMSPDKIDIITSEVEKGFVKAGGEKSFKDFDIAPFITVQMGDDLDACRLPIKQFLALYIGGMGSKTKNYYKDFAAKLGYEDEVIKIQELYLAGKKEEAMAEVPDELVDEISLIGPKQHIQDQVQKWLAKSDYIKTMICTVTQPEALPVLKEALGE
ncbi:MAG: LLM class F420-dependent oxidoreductase [Gammaproteobacteria bacterium]|jgi:F420-dependent oxidoreductase-like protein|nr:LLM class F420-dependent oxidoreductase [Gammaproteobacteria bacterium]